MVSIEFGCAAQTLFFYPSKNFDKPNIREISISMYVGNTLKKVSKVEIEIKKIELIKVAFDER